MSDIEMFLKLFYNLASRDDDINITLPCVNNLSKDIDNCFLQLDYKIKILVYLISPDLFELIKPYIEYYPKIQYYCNKGRRYSLLGEYHGGRVIIDSSLTNHNFGWLFVSTNEMFTKHKLIIS